MAFALGRFVRHLPPAALRAYCSAKRIDLGDRLDGAHSETRFVKLVVAAIEELPAATRETVYGDFERVDQLADEVGERAIRCAFSDPNVATRLFEDMQGAHERALWLLVYHEDAFRRAEEIRFSEYYRNSRLWDGFLAPKGLAVSLDHDQHKAFRGVLQDLFRRTDGSGRRIELEVFTRADANGADPLSQVTVYVEGLPESMVEFGDYGLDRRVQRPAIEVALTYCPGSGAIDAIAKGGRPVRERLARVFLAELLHATNADIEALPLRPYNLRRLARPMDFPTDLEDGIKTVRVICLRLSPHRGPGKVTLEVPRAAAETLYELAGEWFDHHDPLRNGFRVQHAKLVVEFHPAPGASRGKLLGVELTAPRSCNLKDRTRYERLIGEKYLERWGLLEAV